MFHIIYQTTNLINGKIYIGKHSTDDLFDGYIGSGDSLKLAIVKYGFSNFECVPIFFAFDEDSCYFVESLIVDSKFVKRKDTYNKIVGGRGYRSGKDHYFYGKTLSVETKLKISESSKGDKNHFYGKKHKDSTKERISNTKTGVSNHTEESKAKLAEYCKNRVWTEENRLKLSLLRIGFVYSDESKERMSISAKKRFIESEGTMLGNNHTQEAKDKISKANSGINNGMFGKKMTQEQKDKLKFSKLGKKRKQIQCPHCDKIGGDGMMQRWHFENCKLKKNIA